MAWLDYVSLSLFISVPRYVSRPDLPDCLSLNMSQSMSLARISQTVSLSLCVPGFGSGLVSLTVSQRGKQVFENESLSLGCDPADGSEGSLAWIVWRFTNERLCARR